MGFLKKVIAKRAGGDKPSPLAAAAAAVVAGVVVAVLVYKLLRSG